VALMHGGGERGHSEKGGGRQKRTRSEVGGWRTPTTT